MSSSAIWPTSSTSSLDQGNERRAAWRRRGHWRQTRVAVWARSSSSSSTDAKAVAPALCRGPEGGPECMIVRMERLETRRREIGSEVGPTNGAMVTCQDDCSEGTRSLVHVKATGRARARVVRRVRASFSANLLENGPSTPFPRPSSRFRNPFGLPRGRDRSASGLQRGKRASESRRRTAARPGEAAPPRGSARRDQRAPRSRRASSPGARSWAQCRLGCG
jgi:membrane peptidoglycan carboxypeptidase